MKIKNKALCYYSATELPFSKTFVGIGVHTFENNQLSHRVLKLRSSLNAYKVFSGVNWGKWMKDRSVAKVYNVCYAFVKRSKCKRYKMTLFIPWEVQYLKNMGYSGESNENKYSEAKAKNVPF